MTLSLNGLSNVFVHLKPRALQLLLRATKASVVFLLMGTSTYAEQFSKIVILGELPEATEADTSFCDEKLKAYSREYVGDSSECAIQSGAAVLVFALGYPFAQEHLQSLENFPLLKEYYLGLVEEGKVPGSTTILPGGIEGKLKNSLICSPKGEQRRCLFVWPRSETHVHVELCDSLHSSLKN